MKKIGIFGGTFDPVHNGHISLAKDAIELVGLDDMIFMPTYIQPFKQDKDITDGNQRLTMLRFAIEEHPSFALSNYEMRSQGVSYTYKTMRVIMGAYSDEDRLYFICGTDTFLKIESWKESEELLENYSYIVGTRPGYKETELNETMDRLKKNYGTEIINIDNKLVDVSSTEIRKKIQQGESIEGLMPESVERYILENGLYK